MSDCSNLSPLNPQEVRLLKKKQERKKKPKPKIQKVEPVIIEQNDEEVTEKVMPSQAMKDLKNDIQKRVILSNLSKEEETEETVITAREHPDKLQPVPAEIMDMRLKKIRDIWKLVKDLRERFLRKFKEVDQWNMKYRKRLVDMHLDVREYEKKLKNRIRIEKARVLELLELAELNKQKRLWVEQRIAKSILEHPKKTLLTTVIELGFNITQSLLWMLAKIRDFFANP